MLQNFPKAFLVSPTTLPLPMIPHLNPRTTLTRPIQAQLYFRRYPQRHPGGWKEIVKSTQPGQVGTFPRSPWDLPSSTVGPSPRVWLEEKLAIVNAHPCKGAVGQGRLPDQEEQTSATTSKLAGPR